jgi:hypothetical protein
VKVPQKHRLEARYLCHKVLGQVSWRLLFYHYSDHTYLDHRPVMVQDSFILEIFDEGPGHHKFGPQVGDHAKDGRL